MFKKVMSFFEPDKSDPLKVRRHLALASALWSFILWPHELIFLYIVFDVNVDLLKALLIYICTLSGTSIGVYLFNCAKDDALRMKNNADLDRE